MCGRGSAAQERRVRPATAQQMKAMRPTLTHHRKERVEQLSGVRTREQLKTRRSGACADDRTATCECVRAVCCLQPCGGPDVPGTCRRASSARKRWPQVSNDLSSQDQERALERRIL